MSLHTREWGQGHPVIALHPLGLESSAFADIGKVLGEHGLRTLAVDLPGFGQSPWTGEPLTPARMARPVVELARQMDTPPDVIGVSMGGRVALEAALSAPDAFGRVAAIAPFLPWLRLRWAMPLAHLMSPWLAEKIPLEVLWPVLKELADGLERIPPFRDDALAQAAVRAIYYSSCPTTRASIVSAAREMALDPASGPDGLWSRLPSLADRTSFFWGEHDRLVPVRFAYRLRRTIPRAVQRVFPCAGHVLNGPHHGCLATGVASFLDPARDAAPGIAALPCRLAA